jgi:hypothetical protein
MSNFKVEDLNVKCEILELVKTQEGYSYQTMMTTAMGNLAVPSDINFLFSNPLTVSTRFSPYMEIIVQLASTDTDYSIFNTFLKYTSEDLYPVVTNDADQLVIPLTSPYYYKLIYKNDKRNYICDSQIYYSTVNTDAISIDFKYKHNSNAICRIPNGNTVAPSTGVAYSVSEVTRNSIFFYYPGTTIYLLIDFSNSRSTTYGFSIFIMQSYTQQIYDVTSNNLNNLSQYLNDTKIVGEGNTIPSSFVYSYMVLNKVTTLTAVSVNTAYLLQDGLKNSYVFLDPEYSNNIYINYY